MILCINTERALAEIAADAVREGGARRSDISTRPWRFPPPDVAVPDLPRVDIPGTACLPTSDPIRRRLVHAIAAAVVGDADSLHEILTEDAIGWSPTLAYTCREEAETAVREADATLLVERFDIDTVHWSPPVAFAEWRLTSRLAEPILVGDDVLIEPSDQPIRLPGASLVAFRHDRVLAVHSYFDDAALIEQVMLENRGGAGGTTRGARAPARHDPTYDRRR